jgi:hypothetical protein
MSRLIPVPMVSTYRLEDGTRERAAWWQWRGRAFAIRRVAA